MKTICYIAHDQLENSTSQQFLMQAGKQVTSTEYIDLNKQRGCFDIDVEISRLVQADHIIFQFPLYWYQAPAVLKEWIDIVWMKMPEHQLKGKSLGLVVVVGGKKSHYQIGGKHGYTVSELLVPYQLLAKSFGMEMKNPFEVYQFQYMTEEQKKSMMWHYLYYLENKDNESFPSYQHYLLLHASKFSESLADSQNLLWEMFMNKLHSQAEEMMELMTMMKGWD